MRLKIEHPVALDKEVQDRLVANFKKAMLGIDGNDKRDGAIIAYLRFNPWKRELLEAAANGRKDDAGLRRALAVVAARACRGKSDGLEGWLCTAKQEKTFLSASARADRA